MFFALGLNIVYPVKWSKLILNFITWLVIYIYIYIIKINDISRIKINIRYHNLKKESNMKVDDNWGKDVGLLSRLFTRKAGSMQMSIAV